MMFPGTRLQSKVRLVKSIEPSAVIINAKALQDGFQSCLSEGFVGIVFLISSTNNQKKKDPPTFVDIYRAALKMMT